MTAHPPCLGIIIGSTREGRFGGWPAHRNYELAKQRIDLAMKPIDLRDHPSTVFDERISPASAPTKYAAAQRCAATLKSAPEASRS